MRHANNNANAQGETTGVRWTHTTQRGFRLSKLERFTHSVNQRQIKKLVVVVITSLIALQGASPAMAAPGDHLRLYAHSRLISFEQFLCFNKIITKESNWRVNAKNGSHHGLGQMRSKSYRNLDGYRQIDQTIKYITNRYETPCKAWAFHQKHNWF
jgi:hypothetical protein